MIRSAEFRRLTAILWTVLLALWGVQVWRPQISYPRQGMLEVLLALGVLILATYLSLASRTKSEGATKLQESALSRGSGLAAGLGLGFLLYAWARWAADGFPAVGSDNFGTLLGCAVWATASFHLLNAWRNSEPETSEAPSPLTLSPLLTLFYAFISLVALGCGIHALAQHQFLYDRTLRDLLQAIGPADPTPLQLGLIHHLRLKRVASVWGDPNTLAGFSALSLAASFFCAGAWTRRRRSGEGSAATAGVLTSLAALSIPAALVSILLSGSRGGVLDALLVVALAALLRARTFSSPPAMVFSGALFLLAAALPQPLPAVASASAAAAVQEAPAPEQSLLPRFLTRIDTVRERVNYARVGAQIIGRNPIFGSGPGAVDLFYGRYKPPEAREAKFLHNWPLQIAAELGIVGLLLALAFVAALLRPAVWRSARAAPSWRPALIMAVVFLFDALIQISFNQRELMALFGLLIGVMLHAAPSSAAADAPATARRIAPAVVTLLLVVASGIHLLPALYSSAEKQAAQDALDAGEVPEAVRHLRNAAAWSPRDPYPLLSLGLIEAQRGGPDSGALLVERALRLQPQSANLSSQLAALRLQAGRLGEAEALARRAIELYPTNAEHHSLLSRIREAQGDLAGALQSARLAARYGYLHRQRHEERVRQLEIRLNGTAPQ